MSFARYMLVSALLLVTSNVCQAQSCLMTLGLNYLFGQEGAGPPVSETSQRPVSSDERGAVRRPFSVGQVFIVGNGVDNDVILKGAGLVPGKSFYYSDLRLAERGMIETRPLIEGRCSIEVLDPEDDATVKDILIQVQENHTGNLMSESIERMQPVSLREALRRNTDAFTTVVEESSRSGNVNLMPRGN